MRQVARAEQKLRGIPILTPRHGPSQIGVGVETADCVRAGEFHPINLALGVIKRREDQRLPKQPVIELVPRSLVIAVHAHLQSRREILGNTPASK